MCISVELFELHVIHLIKTQQEDERIYQRNWINVLDDNHRMSEPIRAFVVVVVVDEGDTREREHSCQLSTFRGRSWACSSCLAPCSRVSWHYAFLEPFQDSSSSFGAFFCFPILNESWLLEKYYSDIFLLMKISNKIRDDTSCEVLTGAIHSVCRLDIQ